jgi:hypothetical protein
MWSGKSDLEKRYYIRLQVHSMCHNIFCINISGHLKNLFLYIVVYKQQTLFTGQPITQCR